MNANKFAIGILAGSLVGAVAGLMMAPKTGTESRQIVVSRAGRVRSKAGVTFTTLRQRVRRSSPLEVDEESNNGHMASIG